MEAHEDGISFISLIPEDLDSSTTTAGYLDTTAEASCDCRKRDDIRSSGSARSGETTNAARPHPHRLPVPVASILPFSIHYCRLLLILGCLTRWQGVAAIQLPDVYWNSSNPIFRIDNTDHIMDVNKLPGEYDRVNIYCPRVVKSPVTSGDSSSTDPDSSAARNGYYIIYNVSKEEYETCRVTSRTARRMLVCDNPASERLSYITITFRPFSPQPNGPEFHAGQDYYFISTSTGTEAGLDNKSGGRCLSHNMKLLFKVAGQESLDNNDDQTVGSQARPAQTTFKLAQQERLPVYETVVDSSTTAERPATILPFFFRPRTTPYRPRIMKYSPKPPVQQVALNVIDTDNNDLPATDVRSSGDRPRQSVDDDRFGPRTTTQDYFNVIREEDAAVNARQTKTRPPNASAAVPAAGYCPRLVILLLLAGLAMPRMLAQRL